MERRRKKPLRRRGRIEVRTAAKVLLTVFLPCLGACASTPLDVEALRASCQVPGRCEIALPCEGAKLTVRGQVDYRNVFDRARNPRVVDEKFRLVDVRDRHAVEVWVVADSAAVFDRLLAPAARSAPGVRVTGVARGFDMPVMSSCSRGVRLELGSASDLVIER